MLLASNISKSPTAQNEMPLHWLVNKCTGLYSNASFSTAALQLDFSRIERKCEIFNVIDMFDCVSQFECSQSIHVNIFPPCFTEGARYCSVNWADTVVVNLAGLPVSFYNVHTV